MTPLPPLVPQHVDLRDFGYMPLDALRLRDSDLAIEASAEVFRASVLLWCASWHQVPAGSLPNKDKTLADYSRAGARWPRIRAEVMSRWVECSDGRLYHPVVAEKAREAQAAKDAQKARTKAATEAKAAKARALKEHQDEDLNGERNVERYEQRDEQRDDDRNDLQGKGREGKGIEEKNIGAIAPHPGKPGKPAAMPTIPCPYAAIAELYHAKLPSLPGCKLMPKARQQAMRKVWGWVLSSTKTDGERRATTAEEALVWLGGYFDRASQNDFLMGRTRRSDAHAGWVCDLDFLLTDRGMKQVIEKTVEAA